MLRLLVALLLSIAANRAAAQLCPDPPDTGDAIAALMDRLGKAPDEATGRVIEDAIWHLWIKAPDERSQDLLDKGMRRREAYDFEEAERLFDELIAYCPDYPEGYNQRAFIRFLREKYDESLEDLDRVLDAMPDHFAALSGKALVLMRQGRMQLGQAALRKAVELHPWIRERGMLIREPGEKL